MVDSPRRQRLNLPVAPLVAAVIGGVIALAFALIPTGLLEDLVIDSGIAAVVAAAEPPLGVTARAVLILAAGGGAALVAWFGLFLLMGDRAIVVQKAGASAGEEVAPVLRRADAHPDAPARRPLSAHRELGTPFLEVRAHRPVHARAEEMVVDAEFEDLPPEDAAVERPLPADLDMPLAAYDPAAIPEEPVDWALQAPSLLRTPRQQVFDPGERFETFELTPLIRRAVVDSTPVPVAEPAPEPDAQAEPAPVRIRAPVKISAPEPAVAPIEVPATVSEPVFEPLAEPIRTAERVYAPAPIAPPEPMPAFAPTEARAPAIVEPAYTPVPIATPEPIPSFAPAPAADPAQFFRTKSPFRAEDIPVEQRAFAPSRPRASKRVEIDPSASIHALLDRLERGVGRREMFVPPSPQGEDSLQEAIVTLRRLAARA